ncbi:ATP-binding protein [Streptomyces sp. CC208A]|uniref:ATP-binding protein n=1 Tax=Streptomyces sp. CC208A TaxID=3044573 RepID=UPI0024A8A671|nr:ATP-binding protein [Streptomyces sp. CC208A]
MLDAPTRGRLEFYFSTERSQSRVLPCDPASVAVARRLVVALLDHWELSELADRAALVVSELATNSVVHARTCGASIRVAVTLIENDRVEIAVTDLDRRRPVLRQARPSDEGGRGLDLVAAVSRNWGCERRHWGKRVWAELAPLEGA